MLRPYPLSAVRIEAAALAEDKKRCRKIGPCGVGKQALYLNSYFLDRRYYIPFSAVDRIYKRIAMSKGGFSGKGIFATLAYLVVVFDGGREKAFQFKYEAQIDELLAVVRETYPDIPCVSAAAEKRIEEERIRRETERKNRPPMGEPAKKTVRALDRAIDYLQQRPELAEHLSSAGKAPPQLPVYKRKLSLGGHGDHTARLCRAGLWGALLPARRYVCDLFHPVWPGCHLYLRRLQRAPHCAE